MSAETGQKPLHATVCIATYRRPAGLRALIDSLNALEFTATDLDVTLVIVDNDPANPAAPDPGDLISRSAGRSST